jgi:hypothetical protein
MLPKLIVVTSQLNTPPRFVYDVFNAQPTCLTLNFNLPVLVKHQF